MRNIRRLALGASILASLAIVGTAGGGALVTAQEQPTVRIGSDNFYESKLMAEIYARALEGAGFTVDRQLGLGTRFDRAPAFEQGQIDMSPEYVGSGLGYYVAGSENADVAALAVSGDGPTNAANLQAAYDLLGIEATVLGITPGEDTNAAAVRADTAAELGLTTIGDLAAVAGDLTFGLPPECETNALCKGALEQYGLDLASLQTEALAACDAPIAQALASGVVDFAWLCSTQPAIAQNGFVVLVDDLDTQPAENLAPVVRNDWLAQVDGGAETVAAILDPVSAAVTTEVLTELGVRVAVDQEDIEDVAAAFLDSLEMAE
jgi:osmoprotectant transport system substrate-binding protein